MPFLVIEKPVRGHCRRCSSPMATRGYRVVDAAGVKEVICIGHLGALLVGCCQPEATHRIGSELLDRTIQNHAGFQRAD